MHFCTGYIHFLPHFSQSHLIITSTTVPEHMDRRRAARPTDIVGNADPCAVDLALLRLAAEGKGRTCPNIVLGSPLPAQAEILIAHRLAGGERFVDLPAVKVLRG